MTEANDNIIEKEYKLSFIKSNIIFKCRLLGKHLVFSVYKNIHILLSFRIILEISQILVNSLENDEITNYLNELPSKHITSA